MSDISTLASMVADWENGQRHASVMSQEEIAMAEHFRGQGLLGNFGSAVHPGGVYFLLLEGEIALGTPPDWWVEMSPREQQTHAKLWARTVDDYLTILHERPDVSFGEFDNVALLDQMVAEGLIKWRTDRISKHTGMVTSLWPELTDAGRRALKEGK